MITDGTGLVRRVQDQRIRRLWLSLLRNANATRPMCLTIRLSPSLRALDGPVSMAAMIACCQVSTVVARGSISGTLPAEAKVWNLSSAAHLVEHLSLLLVGESVDAARTLRVPSARAALQ